MAYLHPSLQDREFNFEDIIMVPHRTPDFPRSAVSLRSRATKDIEIYVPFLSAPMDTVTGYQMAIMLELLGGIGVIHYNYPTVDDQIRELQRVKNYKAAFVRDPVCLRPDNTVADVYRINDERGFFSVPVTEDGTPHTRLLGFVTRRDVRYIDDKSAELKYVMTPRERLVVAHRRDTMDRMDIRAANARIRDANLDTLIIVDDNDTPCALVTDRDLRLHERYPHASVDGNKQLYGFVAIRGAWHDPKSRETEMERIHKAAEAGADCLVIDQGVVYASQIEIARYIKEHFPEMQVGVGNIAAGTLVRELMEKAGDYIDMIKVGVGPGGACITQQELGVGRLQPSAVYDCACAVKEFKGRYGDRLPTIIADGGIRSAADATKMLASGADAVMMGQMLAGLEESPQPAEHRDGRLKKKFRGMGSAEAMEAGSSIRYGVTEERVRVPEGIVKYVDYLGPGEPFVTLLAESVRQSIGKQGFRSIQELQAEGMEGCWIYPYSER